MAVTTVIASELVDWRQDREVARLTDEIVALHTKAEMLVADAVVQMGVRIAMVKDRLPESLWLEWIDLALPFEKRTADRCIAMAEWAAGQPAEFERLRTLGVSKLYHIVALEPPRRRGLRPTTVYMVRGIAKTIAVMSERELGQALRLPAKLREDIAEVAQKVKHARHMMSGTGAAIDALIADKSKVDEKDARALKKSLVSMVARLESAFGV